MPNSLSSTRGHLAGFDVRKADQSARDARRNEINAAQAEFSDPDFIMINDIAFRKSTVDKISFGDTMIYARFRTGDVVEISPEQLRELTNSTSA